MTNDDTNYDFVSMKEEKIKTIDVVRDFFPETWLWDIETLKYQLK